MPSPLGKVSPKVTEEVRTFAKQKCIAEGDLYGKEIKVSFVRFLREVRKFDTPQALRTQLKEDIGRVRRND